jgi:hypothetical protein
MTWSLHFLSSLVLLNAADFVSSTIHGAGTGAIGQTRPFLPGVLPQSLCGAYDVCAGDDEHDDGDDRTAMAMAMAMECG